VRPLRQPRRCSGDEAAAGGMAAAEGISPLAAPDHVDLAGFSSHTRGDERLCKVLTIVDEI